MLDWHAIASVFLDMDGTLLDLRYDNHFWREFVPRRYAQARGLSEEEGRAECFRRYQAKTGTLDWYCVDYWSSELELDIATLKEEVAHLIAVHPGVAEFLNAAVIAGKRVVLVTNAHAKSLDLKMRRTGLDIHFDALISAHQLGLPKENPAFWDALRRIEPFDPRATLLVDDSQPVLRSAREYGIAHLLAVEQPDTGEPARDGGEFHALASFRDLLPVT